MNSKMFSNCVCYILNKLVGWPTEHRTFQCMSTFQKPVIDTNKFIILFLVRTLDLESPIETRINVGVIDT